MRRFTQAAAGGLILAALAAGAHGQGEIAGANVARQLRVNIAWQVALEASDFSPGVLDGVFKRKGVMALTEYAGRYFPGKQIYDDAVGKALKVDVDGALVNYEVTPEDAALVGGPLPDDWNEKAQLKRLNYESLADCITEKFHCTQGLLEALNPGVKFASLAPGQRLVVPNIQPFPADNKVTVTRRQGAASVTVNLGEKTIRIFDDQGGQLALFHCSIAKDKNKLPDRDMKVDKIAAPFPNYTFDPLNWPEVHNVNRILTIPPGPRNPVGLAWVSMDLKGYGIHGTPKPELIGKTGSHGCFRLTNWDALKFAGWVRDGMIVKVINPDTNPQ
ncbi:MAG TPA: L,D-transpeptidase [Phycisphaerae bacterium]|nr:L,D-transpeptidase [Phycisphaerae bacterium]